MKTFEQLLNQIDNKEAKVSFSPVPIDLGDLVSRCAKEIEMRLGWKNLLGSVESVLKEIMPIVLEEIHKGEKS